MITFVMLVEDGNLDNAVGTLENNLPGFRETWNVLVLTKDKQYPKIRNRIYKTIDDMPNQECRGECLVSYNEKASFEQARSFLKGFPGQSYVFLWVGNKMPIGSIQELENVDIANFFHAGIIGYGSKYYVVGDDKLYDHRIRFELKEAKEHITEITALPNTSNVLARLTVLQMCDTTSDKIGLDARRKGYRNFLVKGGK